MLQQHTFSFEHNGEPVAFHAWSHLTPGKKPTTVLFLGAGQIGRLPYWVARASVPGTVVIQGAPIWKAHSDTQDIYDFMKAYCQAALQAVQQEFSLQHVHVVAESQATPGVVSAANTLSELVRNVVLVAPLGFSAHLLGDSPEARLHRLRRRAIRSMLQMEQSPLHDPRNLYAGIMILRGMFAEVEHGATRRKFAAGLSYDMRKDCRALLALQRQTGAHCTVLLGARDRLFPAQEVQEVINTSGLHDLVVRILPDMTHSSLATRGGRMALLTALEIARS